MRSILYSELIKLKGSKILWMVAVGAFLPAILLLLTASNIVHSSRHLTFLMLIQNAFFFLNLIMGPPLFCLISGFVVARENQDRTINQLFMYPQSRVLFILGKWFVLLPIIFITTLLLFILVILMGAVYFHLPITASQFIHYLLTVLLVIALQWLLTPLSMGVSMVGKSYIPSMVLGIAMVLCSIFAIQSEKYNSFFPYSAVANLMYNWLGEPLTQFHLITSFLSITITFVATLTFCTIYYARSSIHNG
jgi:hypothetical protein